MSTITPMLDTLLPQVLGRRGDVERLAATAYNRPLAAVRAPAPARANDTESEPRERGGLSSRLAPASGASRGLDAATTAAAQTPAAGGHAGAASTRLHFSGAARAIARLLQRFADAPAAATIGRAPLLAAGQAPAVPVLATALAQQVGYSGVFYEAHLWQWLQAKRAEPELYKEPQMRLFARPRPQTGTGESRATAAHAAEHRGDRPAIDERLLPVLRQQLDTASGAVFRWQGQAWPGASMQWEIRSQDEPARRPRAVEPTIRRYTTSLRLALPALGSLEVRLALAGDTVHIHAWAERGQGAARLRAERASLRQRLRAAGFKQAVVELVAGEAR